MSIATVTRKTAYRGQYVEVTVRDEGAIRGNIKGWGTSVLQLRTSPTHPGARCGYREIPSFKVERVVEAATLPR